MLSTLLILLVVLLGHGMLLILSVNVSHGLGVHSRWAESITLSVLGVMGLASLGFAAWVLLGHPWNDWPRPLQAYARLCALVALVGFPLSTLARALRPIPSGVFQAQLPPAPPEPEIVSASASLSRLHRLPGNQSLNLQVQDWRMPVAGLPASLQGLRIVHLTDWHMSPLYDRRFFEHAVEQANRLDPDLVLFSGDLIEHESAIAWIEPILGALSARLGKLAILGNHDLLYGPDAILREVERAGFENLEGRWTTLDADGQTIALGGTSAPWGRPPLDPSACPDAALRIVLSHTPDRFYRIASWNAVDLIVAGHNHGGQIRLPIIGPILMPSIYSRRFDQGFFRRGRSWMYVSRGLGAKHPIRYGCPPELTRIVLQEPAGSETRAVRSPSTSVRVGV